MTSTARCSMPPLAVLANAASLLTGCATVASDVGVLEACPPVVEYSREFQARAAEELALLPEESAIEEMFAPEPMCESARLQMETSDSPLAIYAACCCRAAFSAARMSSVGVPGTMPLPTSNFRAFCN